MAALNDALACFAGIWTNWTSVRKAKEGEVTSDIQEVDVWLNAPTPAALELRIPLAGAKLGIVAKGERTDAG